MPITEMNHLNAADADSYTLSSVSRLMRAGLAIAFMTLSMTVNATPDILLKAENGEMRLPDFSYAGYRHGETEIPNVQKRIISVTDFGAVANDGKDDSKAILKAIEKANSTKGSVVLLFPKGRLIVSEVLRITRGDMVLRGAGSGRQGTTLFFPRPLAMIDKGESLSELTEYLSKYDKRQREEVHNIDELFSEYSWSGGFIWVQKPGTRSAPYLVKNDPEIEVVAVALEAKAASRSILVKSSADLEVGDVLELQWLNRDGESGELLKQIYGDTSLKIGSHHWTNPDRPLVRQKTEIVAIDQNNITISDPLLHDISEEVPAQFARWEHLSEVGIEDLSLEFPNAPSFGHHLERGFNGVYFTSVYNGWIRDISIRNADSGVLSYNSANVTISDIQSLGQRKGHYAVHAGNVHNVLVQNLMIRNPLQHSLSFNTQSTKSVFLNTHVFETPVLDQHAGANHQNLYDHTHFYISALRDDDDRAFYPIWDGSGAGYWQPGHGRYNTTWNLKVIVEGGASRDEIVTLEGLAEGPDARIVGVSGNRKFKLDYRPQPYVEGLNQKMKDVPSLYQWQLNKRLSK